VSTTRPASLDGSLPARKGDAAPAIANDSPLLEELGEPRPAPSGGRLGAKKAFVGAPSALLGLLGNALAWLAGHPVFGVLGLAIGIAILFAVTIAALTPSPDATSSPTQPAPAASDAGPEKIILPTDGKSMAETSDAVMEAATKPSKTTMAPPDPPAAIALPEPPAKIVAPEPPAAVVAAKPPAKRAVAASPSRRSGRYLLQLSAVADARSARSELVRLEKRLGRLLGKRKIIVVKAVPPGKPPVYRLRASSYNSRAAARAACTQIRKRKMACIVVKR
jgi:hypothetical protein